MNEHKTADEIERDIRETETEIARTLDLIQNKVSPGAVVDTLLRTSRENGAEFAANFGRSVRDNPLPVTLIGTGLAWLMLSRRGNGHDHQRLTEYPESYHESHREREDASRIQRAGIYSTDAGEGEGYAAAHESAVDAVRSEWTEQGTSSAGSSTEETMSELHEETSSPTSGASAAARRAEERAREAAHTAQERARSLGDRAGASVRAAQSAADRGYSGARSAAGEAYSGARSKAGEAYSGARAAGEHAAERLQAGSEAAYRRGSEVARRTTTRASEAASAIGASLREHPLAAGVILAGVGAIVGALLPVTRREDAWMGEHSDAVKAKAADAVEHQAERVRDIAAAVAEGARSEAEARGLTPAAAAEKLQQQIRRVAEDGTEVARAAIREGEAAAKRDERSQEENRGEENREEENREEENGREENRGERDESEMKPGAGHVYPRMQAAPSPGPSVPPATPVVRPAVTPPATTSDPLKQEK